MKKFLVTLAAIMAATCSINYAASLSSQEQARLAASPWKAEVAQQPAAQPRVATTATAGAKTASSTSPFAARRASRPAQIKRANVPARGTTQMGISAPAVTSPVITTPEIITPAITPSSRVIEGAAETFAPEITAPSANLASGLGRAITTASAVTTPSLSDVADVEYLRSAQYEFTPTAPITSESISNVTPSTVTPESTASSWRNWLPSWLGGAETAAPVAATEAATTAAATEGWFSKYTPTRESLSKYVPTREGLQQRWEDLKTGVTGGVAGLQTTAAETAATISKAYQEEGFGAACKEAGGQFTSSVQYRPKTYTAVGLGALALGGYFWYRWYNQLERKLLRAVQSGNLIETDALFVDLTDRLNAAQGKPDYNKQAEATTKIFVDADTLAAQRKEASTMPQYDKVRELIFDAISRIHNPNLRAQIKGALESQPAEGKPGQLAPGTYTVEPIGHADFPEGKPGALAPGTYTVVYPEQI